MMRRAWRRRSRAWMRIAVWIVALAALAWGGLEVALALSPYPAERLAHDAWGSTQVVDRKGRPLRDVLHPERGRARWVPLDAIAPAVVEATLAGEDHRFYAHSGVDPWAVLRALGLFARHGRVYSGASTITMQLARSLDPSLRGSMRGKLGQVWDALRLERALSKEQLLEHYLNRVPYGNHTHGVEAASRRYFGVSADGLSDAQAALLAALPRAPSAYNPYRHLERALARQRHLLGLMARRGALSPEAHDAARAEAIVLRPRPGPFHAPHAVDQIVRAERARIASERPPVLVTTLDLELQRIAERAVRVHLEELERRMAGRGDRGEPLQAAAMIVDVATGEIRALVGSRDWHDDEALGQINGARIGRSPGSTLKPLLAAQAIDALGWGPSTVLPDVPRTFRGAAGRAYAPRNFDGRFRGPVTLRQTLAGSLNVPSVHMLDALGGPEAAVPGLRRLGLSRLDAEPGRYGLSLALGGAEVTLWGVVEAYATLSRGGVHMPLRLVRADAGDEVGLPRRAVSAEAAWMVAEMLSDEGARASVFGHHSGLQFGGAVAFKTGTSDGWRDGWTVGFSRRYAVGVWVGRLDRSPLGAFSGSEAAGPLFAQLMHAAHHDAPPPAWGPRPPGIAQGQLCATSGLQAGPSCPHVTLAPVLRRRAVSEACGWHTLAARHPERGRRVLASCAPDQPAAPALALPRVYLDWARARGIDALELGAGCGHAAPTSQEATPEARRAWPVQIASPAEGDVYVLDPSRPRAVQTLRLRATGALARGMRWRLDDAPLTGAVRSASWEGLDRAWPLARGAHRLEVVDAAGRPVSAAVMFEVR